MPELIMPRLSDTMEDGVLLEWLVEDGAEVSVGDAIADVETDKATMTLSAEHEGTFRRFVPAGETYTVAARIGWIGDDAPSVEEAPSDGVAADGDTATNGGAAPQPPPDPAVADRPPARAGTSRTSPLARRLASDLGVDLEQVVGTGPNGRISKRDVELAASQAAAPEPAPAASSATASVPAATTRPLNRVQQLIARRMVTTQREVPDFAVDIDADVDAAAELRRQLTDLGEEHKVSFNDMIVKASALALREHPGVNSSYREDEVVLHAAVNVGVAVAAPGNLVVPVIRDADKLSLRAIAAETRRLATAVRDANVDPADLSGGTFTVSNPGMFGIHAVTPIVNGEEAAILGVGAIREELARRDGEIVDRRVCHLRLSCDHRIVYGAEAAAFLATVADLIQRPLSLLATN